MLKQSKNKNQWQNIILYINIYKKYWCLKKTPLESRLAFDTPFSNKKNKQ